MRSKEKAALTVKAREGGAGDQISGPAVRNPVHDSITEGSSQQGLSALLPCGEENAITSQEFMERTGFTSARQLQKRIAAERERGALILATEQGYFLPSEGMAGRHELHRFIQTLERRAAGTLKAAESARAALKVLDDQKQIEGGVSAEA